MSNDSTRILNVGMIGVARYGAHRRATMRRTGLFRVRVCCDRDAQALRQACDEEGAQPADSYEQMLATPGIEAVVISTGVDSHADLAIRAMERGLHVFVEKPLCGRLEEVHLLRQAQRRTSVVVGVGHMHAGRDPIVRTVREHLERGTLGTLTAYEENTSHSGGLEIRPGDWRGLRDRNPGGMLLQCGVHALHRLVHLFGPIERVGAMMRYDANQATQTADAACTIIRHRSGLIGTLNCFHVTPYCHELRLFGTKATLYLDTHHRQARLQERRPNAPEPRVEVPFARSEGADECANLVSWHAAICSGGEADPSLEDGIAAVLPVFAAERADETGQTVAIEQLDASPAVA